MFLVCDLGNTHLRLGVFEGADNAPRRVVCVPADGFDAEVLDAALQTPLRDFARVVVSSVNPAAWKRLDVLLSPAARRVMVGPGCSGALDLNYEPLQTLGADRVAACAGAAYLHGLPAVVVDAGTAITVDRVDRGPVFAGGMIFPGPALCAQALSRTSQLPCVEPEAAARPMGRGRSTEACIRAGLYAGIRGAVAGMVQAMGGNAALVVTGGAADALAGLFPGAVTDPHLVLRGAALCARALPDFAGAPAGSPA